MSDENLVGTLEELQKKQNAVSLPYPCGRLQMDHRVGGSRVVTCCVYTRCSDPFQLRSEREKQNPVIDMISPITVPPVRLRRSVPVWSLSFFVYVCACVLVCLRQWVCVCVCVCVCDCVFLKACASRSAAVLNRTHRSYKQFACEYDSSSASVFVHHSNHRQMPGGPHKRVW